MTLVSVISAVRQSHAANRGQRQRKERDVPYLGTEPEISSRDSLSLSRHFIDDEKRPQSFGTQGKNLYIALQCLMLARSNCIPNSSAKRNPPLCCEELLKETSATHS